jgi:hypothetical protein
MPRWASIDARVACFAASSPGSKEFADAEEAVAGEH